MTNRLMRNLYFSAKRKVMRVRCLFGKHNYRMGAPAKGGGGFGCLWCGKKMRKSKPAHKWLDINTDFICRKPETGAE